jgi:alcohol dehydrogenase (cytochrome c)
MSTAGGVVFYGENGGSFVAADAASGRVLWQYPANVVWRASPMTYSFEGRQYVAMAGARDMLVFALPQ